MFDRISKITLPPSGVNLTALDRRLIEDLVETEGNPLTDLYNIYQRINLYLVRSLLIYDDVIYSATCSQIKGPFGDSHFAFINLMSRTSLIEVIRCADE